MGLEAMTRLRRAAVVARRDRQEVILQVRMLDAGAAADEAAGLEMVGRTDAAAEECPLDADQQLAQRVLQYWVERYRLQAAMLHVGLDVILQILADAREIMHDGDAVPSQMVRRPDAGQHE